MRFILDLCRKDPNLQIMYGIGGEKELDREDARPPRRLRRRPPGADRQRRLRPAPARRLGGAARLDLPARKSAAKASGTPADRKLIARAGRGGDRRLAQPRPGDLGGARRAQALRLLEADDLGRGRPRRAPGARRRPRRDRRRLAADRRRDPRGDPRARLPRRRLPPALRDRRPRRLDPADPAGPLPAARRRARAQRRWRRSPTTSPSTASSSATRSRRPTTASAARRGPS